MQSAWNILLQSMRDQTSNYGMAAVHTCKYGCNHSGIKGPSHHIPNISRTIFESFRYIFEGSGNHKNTVDEDLADPMNHLRSNPQHKASYIIRSRQELESLLVFFFGWLSASQNSRFEQRYSIFSRICSLVDDTTKKLKIHPTLELSSSARSAYENDSPTRGHCSALGELGYYIAPSGKRRYLQDIRVITLPDPPTDLGFLGPTWLRMATYHATTGGAYFQNPIFQSE